MKRLFIIITLSTAFISLGQSEDLQDTWNTISVLNSMNSSKANSIQNELNKLSDIVIERGNQENDINILNNVKGLIKNTNEIINQTELIRNYIITKTGGLNEENYPMAFNVKKQNPIFLKDKSQEKITLSKLINIYNETYNASIAAINKLGIDYKPDNLNVPLTVSNFINTNLKISIIQTNSLDKSLRLIRTTNIYLTSSHAKFDMIFVGFDSNSKTVFEGDTLSGRIELIAASSLIEQYLYVDGVKYESTNYQTIASTKDCELIKDNLYECEIKAKIEVIRKDNPKVTMPRTFKYYVLKK